MGSVIGSRRGIALAAMLTVGGFAPDASAQSSFDGVEIEATRLTDSIHVLTGSGGNLAVCVGEDGVFLIDDQFAPLTDKIRAAIADISDQPIRFVLNTHWHGDHTGGNENLGETGSLIVAHDNVHRRMSTENVSTIWDRTTPASVGAALPVVTFDASVSFHVNGETIHAFHVPHAHTDGDAIVHFERANVLHMGDVFFNGLYPFIDTDSGGSLDGIIAAVETALALCRSDTQVIAGHGPVGDLAALRRYHDMLVSVRSELRSMIARGMDLEQIQAAHPTAAWDDPWAEAWIDGDKFVEILYGDLSSN